MVAFSATLTTPAVVPAQLAVVWSLPLRGRLRGAYPHRQHGITSGRPIYIGSTLDVRGATFAAQQVIDHAGRITSEHSAVLIEAPHGAASRIERDATAYRQRDKRYNISGLAIWEEDGTPERHLRWARDLASAVERYSKGEAYVNYLTHEATPEEVRAAYDSDIYQRLRQLKKKYDPTNFFRYNQNIPPAA